MKIRFKQNEIDSLFEKQDMEIIYYFFKIVYLLEKSPYKIIQYSDISEDQETLLKIMAELGEYFSFKDCVTYRDDIKQQYVKTIEDKRKAGIASANSRKKNKNKKALEKAKELIKEEADRVANHWEFGRDAYGNVTSGEHIIFENQRYFVPGGEFIYKYVYENYLKPKA